MEELFATYLYLILREYVSLRICELWSVSPNGGVLATIKEFFNVPE